MFQKIYVSTENSFKAARTITTKGWLKLSAPALKDPAIKGLWGQNFTTADYARLREKFVVQIYDILPSVGAKRLLTLCLQNHIQHSLCRRQKLQKKSMRVNID